MRKSNLNPQLEEANKWIFVKDYERAEEIIEELIKQPAYAEDILLHLRRIELATKTGKLEELCEIYRSAADGQPESLRPILTVILAELHAELMTGDNALDILHDLLKLHGPHAGISFAIGFSHEMNENFEAAKQAYERAIELDRSWHPAYFGLSQVYYHLGDESRGDQYFLLFEDLAPYNVYGNFETHRKLADEFSHQENFEAAEQAVRTLGEWWKENKGSAPLEIQLYEKLATAQIAEQDQDSVVAQQRRHAARLVAYKIIDDSSLTGSVLYFAAKVCEEFSEFTLALEIYRRILKAETTEPEMVQKIGAQFISVGEHKLALELFEEAYETHPDSPEIRFCLLVARLKLAKVNVEDYLISKDRMKKLLETEGAEAELMSLLQALVTKFSGDADVQGNLADALLEAGDKERALRHFERMYSLDSRSRVTTLKYAAYLLNHQDIEQAKRLLDGIKDLHKLDIDEQIERNWLLATYEFRKGHYEESVEKLHKLLESEPWSLSYLLLQARSLTRLAEQKGELAAQDTALDQMARGDEDEVNWTAYDQKTRNLRKARFIELAYVRSKLRYLYTDGDESSIQQLVMSATSYDAQKGIFELLKLLNTNFDGPSIYWALGVLFRETWQLEVASMWFDQMLLLPKLTEKQRARAYLEQADCYIWRGVQLEKAIEFARLSKDLGLADDRRSLRIMAHGLLKLGRVQQAETCLQDGSTGTAEDPEVVYLKGLLKYRNGAAEEANSIWKPLLTYRAESLRLHHIKQEILKYYFDRQPYRAMN